MRLQRLRMAVEFTCGIILIEMGKFLTVFLR